MQIPVRSLTLCALLLWVSQGSQGGEQPGAVERADPLPYKVGFLGIPDSKQGTMILPVAWNAENVARLKSLGFNAIQINVGWGTRPADEVLNLEDVVALTAEQQKELPQPAALRCDPSPRRRAERRAELRERIALCREAGLRTIFHFGAPYNPVRVYQDSPPNCISDPKVARRYVLLLDAFAREFPGVDDILVYTYDQDASVCSEFGPCPRCLGIPLDERLAPFLDCLAATWRKHSPQGRLWWEPWELSAGQALRCVERVHPAGFGLALHCNIAEVMATFPADRWFKNTCRLASERGIPVLAEYFLGGASEELEPLVNLAHPLVTLRGLKALAAVPGVCGIKEYYGLAPDREDPNLRMTGIFFHNPQIGEDEALRVLAEPYGDAAAGMVRFWGLTSQSMELFPWETTWFIRQLGRSRPAHSLSAAILRGMTCHTPSWMSTRHSIFMRIEPEYAADPWMLEDVQLRCQMAADRMGSALALGAKLRGSVPRGLAAPFTANLADLAKFRRRALAYVYHLRETNLAMILRNVRTRDLPAPDALVATLVAVLKADRDNCRAGQSAAPATQDASPAREAKSDALTLAQMDDAIALLQRDVDNFLARYFRESRDRFSKGPNSITSP